MLLFKEMIIIINVYVYISMYIFLLMLYICKIIDDFEIKFCQLYVGSFMLYFKNMNFFVKVCVVDIYEKMFLFIKQKMIIQVYVFQFLDIVILIKYS